MVSYRFMHMNMGSVKEGLKPVDNNYIFRSYLMSPEKMHMDMHMLMLMYGLSERLTIMGMVNYNQSSMSMSSLPGAVHIHPGGDQMVNTEMKMSVSGISDTRLQVLYGIKTNSEHHLLANIGVSIPTGSINEMGKLSDMYASQRMPYSMQNGSGTWDILSGITYLFYNGEWSFSSQASTVLRTGYNKIGYRLGNELASNNWLAYQLTDNFSASLRVEGTIVDLIGGKDSTLFKGYEPSANPVNYGGLKILGSIGVNYYIRNGMLKNNRLGIEYSNPLYQNLNGIQMITQNVLNAAWSYSF